MAVAASGPRTTSDPTVTYTIDFSNHGKGAAPGVSIDDVRRALDIDGKPHTPFGQLGVQARDVFDFAAKLGGAAVGGV